MTAFCPIITPSGVHSPLCQCRQCTGNAPITSDWIIQTAQVRNRPTCDEFAARVWQWSNSGDVSTQEAARVMAAAGYVPFQGFPLVRAKLDRETSDAHEEILAGLASERPHSRTRTADGRPVQWTYDGHGGMA